MNSEILKMARARGAGFQVSSPLRYNFIILLIYNEYLLFKYSVKIVIFMKESSYSFQVLPTGFVEIYLL